MGFLALSHPFLEENGRTILTVYSELCRRAVFHVCWEELQRTNFFRPSQENLSSQERPWTISCCAISERALADKQHTSARRSGSHPVDSAAVSAPGLPLDSMSSSTLFSFVYSPLILHPPLLQQNQLASHFIRLKFAPEPSPQFAQARLARCSEQNPPAVAPPHTDTAYSSEWREHCFGSVPHSRTGF